MKKENILILCLIMFLLVGFAVVNTTIDVNGNLSLSFNGNEFDVRFNNASVNGNGVSISNDGQEITFKQSTDEVVLDYEILNNSTQYDAEVSVNCQTDYRDDNIAIDNTLLEDIVLAKKSVEGTANINIPFYNTLNGKIAKYAVMDNQASKYVTNVSGIDFTKNSSDTNGKGVYQLSNIGETPIYYYRGDVDDNNIIYADFCWKIVRTTETSGVKLIYNGVPDENGSCANNKGNSSLIGVGGFNYQQKSIKNVGYMYGTDEYSVDDMTKSVTMILSRSVVEGDMYGTDVRYDEESKMYYLVNPYKLTDSSQYSDLVGKYTFFNSSGISSDNNAMYITNNYGIYINYFIVVYDSGNIENFLEQYYYTRYFSKSYERNDDGTFLLTNSFRIKPIDWANGYQNYEGLYTCLNEEDNVCDQVYYVSVSERIMNLTPVGIIYGNNFVYEDGRYILKDTVEVNNWGKDFNLIGNHHYTCLSSLATCEEVYYISRAEYYILNGDGNTYLSGYKLKNGVSIIDALEKVKENNYDSDIKKVIDSWYEQNILNYDYNQYLEDTIWCNDRSVSSYGMYDYNGGNFSALLYGSENKMIPDFKCSLNDSFSVGDIGNGKLKYPIALLDKDEIILAGGTAMSNNEYYLYSNASWFLLTPQSDAGYDNTIFVVYDGRYLVGYASVIGAGIRPSVSLKSGMLITDGDGSGSNPYQIKMGEESDKPSSVNVTCKLEVHAISRSEYAE